MSSCYHASDKTNMKILPVLINKQLKKKKKKQKKNKWQYINTINLVKFFLVKITEYLIKDY